MAISNNEILKHQTIVLQNIPPKGPIELKIDSPTDYTALGITVAVSIITAIISAWITISLVDRTNKSLIKSQNQLQQDLIKSQFDQQKNEVNTRNRQEWVKEVRNMIAEFIQLASTFPTQSYDFVISSILVHRQEISEERYLSVSDNHRKHISDLHNLGMRIDLTLSKTDYLDREICVLINEIHHAIGGITQKYNQIISSNKTNTNQLTAMNYLSDQYFTLISHNIESIKNKSKDLLKAEWERVKNLS